MTSMMQPQVQHQLDHLPETADALQATLAVERDRLRHRIDMLGSTLREKAHPQTYWRENPMVVVGAVATVGVVLGLLSSGSSERHRDADDVRRDSGNRASSTGGSMTSRLLFAAVTLVGRRAFSKAIDSMFSSSSRGRATR